MTGWIDLENRSLTGEERSCQHVATTFGIVLRGSPSRGRRNKAANTKVASAIAETLPVIGPSRVRASRRWKAQDVAKRLPAGSTGLAAIYTEHVKAAQVIRKVVLQQTAITNYVNPF